ncbi:hypothetical protein VPH35_057291 [Triticum aestivum]
MALKEGLVRFRLQQERNQAALSALPASLALCFSCQTLTYNFGQQNMGYMSSKYIIDRFFEMRPKETSTARKLAAGAQIRFSDDTARLQKINQVRTSAVGKQIRDVIALLERTREPLTLHQINEKTYVDIDGNGAVAESLRNNAKVRFDGECYSYKRTHDVRGKDELLSLIRTFPDGLPASEVEDAYPSVLEDLQALKSSGDIYLLSVQRTNVFF